MKNNTFEQRLFKFHQNSLSCVSGDMWRILCSDGGQRRVACQAPHSVQSPSQGSFPKKMGRAGKDPGINSAFRLAVWNVIINVIFMRMLWNWTSYSKLRSVWNWCQIRLSPEIRFVCFVRNLKKIVMWWKFFVKLEAIWRVALRFVIYCRHL